MKRGSLTTQLLKKWCSLFRLYRDTCLLAVHTFQFFPALRSHLRNPEKQIAFGVHLLSNPQKYIKQRFKAIAKISACFSQKIIAYES